MDVNKRGLFVLVLVLACVVAALGRSPAGADHPGPIYVDANATGSNDGTSWQNAYTSLQDALDHAGAGDEIWVRRGVYKPGSDSLDYFQLKNGVALYGGFIGAEATRDERDPAANPTVLSGDVDDNDTVDANGVTVEINGANANKVVDSSSTDNTAVLDGFVITGGDSATQGGGLVNNNGSPVLNNLRFVQNYAVVGGGGLFTHGGAPAVSNTLFEGNETLGNGGGLFATGVSVPQLFNVTFLQNFATEGGGVSLLNSPAVLVNTRFFGNVAGNPDDEDGAGAGGGLLSEASSPLIVNTLFSGNTAYASDEGEGGHGGAVLASGGNPRLVNVTLVNNEADSAGGGLYNDPGTTTQLINAILALNVADGMANQAAQVYDATSAALIEYTLSMFGIFSGTGNIMGNPQFVDLFGPDGVPGTLDDNLTIQSSSPGVDAGINSAVVPGLTFDLAGNPRFVDVSSVLDTGSGTAPIVDMGAYEAQNGTGPGPGSDFEIFLPVLVR